MAHLLTYLYSLVIICVILSYSTVNAQATDGDIIDFVRNHNEARAEVQPPGKPNFSLSNIPSDL